jgi:hypothetical protein
MNTQIIITFGIIYLIGVFIFFRAISYRCVMAMYGEYDFSFMNFLIALVFPISIIVILIKAFLDDRKFEKDPKGEFEKFKNKKLKEYIYGGEK